MTKTNTIGRDWHPEIFFQVFSVLFFLMLITLGLGSATGLISSVVGIVCDEKRHWNKTVVTFVICLAGFGLGLIYITPVRCVERPCMEKFSKQEVRLRMSPLGR